MSWSRNSNSSLSGRIHRLPDKLRIIKPLEGSLTLHHWSRLATPHLGGVLEERLGVAIKVQIFFLKGLFACFPVTLNTKMAMSDSQRFPINY